ncbi:hypothetical protein K466DRAFT_315397 [Polyporus arcularius HHB13444]|uniref:Uncharacterized protein n=1 Tax=Polyporus arcularius HHB13444 TaxID=1314778 RepID=A0A5C3NZT4_9APHY|nr:hypothetical protein K466DRAFT_315397 [Polyporus arcularius HHB13444]
MGCGTLRDHPGGPVTIQNTDSSPCRHLVSSTGTGIRGVSAAALWTHMHLSPVLASSAAIFLRRAPLWLHDSIAQRVCIVQEHKTTRSALGLGHFFGACETGVNALVLLLLRRGWNLLGRLSSSCCCVNKPKTSLCTNLLDLSKIRTCRNTSEFELRYATSVLSKWERLTPLQLRWLPSTASTFCFRPSESERSFANSRAR